MSRTSQQLNLLRHENSALKREIERLKGQFSSTHREVELSDFDYEIPGFERKVKLIRSGYEFKLRFEKDCEGRFTEMRIVDDEDDELAQRLENINFDVYEEDDFDSSSLKYNLETSVDIEKMVESGMTFGRYYVNEQELLLIDKSIDSYRFEVVVRSSSVCDTVFRIKQVDNYIFISGYRSPPLHDASDLYSYPIGSYVLVFNDSDTEDDESDLSSIEKTEEESNYSEVEDDADDATYSDYESPQKRIRKEDSA